MAGKRWIVVFGASIIAFGSVLALTKAEPKQEVAVETSQGIAGAWSGVLDAGVMKMTLSLDITEDANGTRSGQIAAVEHGITVPVEAISFDGGLLKFEMKNLMATFEGTLDPEGSAFSGTFSQRGVSYPLTLTRGDKLALAVNKRPQEPKKPYPYLEEEVSYASAEGVKLSGTLTLPNSKDPCPAVVLIAGSGPIDRDESMYGHKPFWVLADHLTRKGIAVLRFDKRGIGQSTGDFASATTVDFARDATAGIEYLKSRKEIDAAKIGLIGHSEGGIIAPMIAAKSEDVAFIVLMAGPGVNGEKILYEQGALMQRANGVDEETIELQRKLQEKVFAIVKSEPDPALTVSKLTQAIGQYWEDLPEEQRKIANLDASTVANEFNSPWMRYFLTHDPSSDLRQVKAPVLAIAGELDLQVPPKQNLPVIAKALQDGGNRDHTVMELPKLNHVFQTCKTGLVTETANSEETIAPQALETISSWILERVVRCRS